MRSDVRRWLSNRTSRGQDWSRRRLAALKGTTRVSVVLPARDEAATVGAIVATLCRELVAKVPLVDEVLVIDSGSLDATATVARAAGARVARQPDVLPRLGDQPGKGEALWKSLLLTTGDLIVFVDDGRSRIEHRPQEDPRTTVDREFVQTVRGERASTRAPYAEALRSHRLGCALAESARTGQPVKLAGQ